MPDHTLDMQSMSSTVRKNSNKRRFTDDQIKFLEIMFESESRPESRIKHQLATDTGLLPRQVAIWFQNRRARLKSKHIEREYNVLKASHDALASSLDSLRKENQSLLNELQKLKPLLASAESESSEMDKIELEGYKYEEENPENEGNKRNSERIDDEIDMLNQSTDGSRISSDWQSFESSCFMEESSNISQWWEYLS